MKEYQIEETIIAYFDGRLSDDERAELLHRVSVSPEIRQLFGEHEMLRKMASRAARNVAVRADMDEAVFARIAALQEQEQEAAPIASAPVRFWSVRRLTSTIAMLGLLAGAGLGVWSYRSDSTTSSASTATSGSHSTATLSAISSTDVTPATSAPSETTVAFGNESSNESTNAREPLASRADRYGRGPVGGHLSSRVTMSSRDQVSTHSAQVNTENPQPAQVATVEAATISLVPQARGVNAILSDERPVAHTLAELRPSDDAQDDFEFGVETASGFSLPAGALQIAPFSDQRFHLAYQLTSNDQIGIRYTYGTFQRLTDAVLTQETGYLSVSRSIAATRASAAELYYLRRESVMGGRFFVDGSLGFGLISQGNLLSAEIGLKIPFGDRFLGGVTFAMSRIHSNAPTAFDLMSQSSTPVIFEGSDVHNTLNGRLQYGLSYRF